MRSRSRRAPGSSRPRIARKLSVERLDARRVLARVAQRDAGTAVATRTKPWACMSKKDVLPLSGGFGGVPAT